MDTQGTDLLCLFVCASSVSLLPPFIFFTSKVVTLSLVWLSHWWWLSAPPFSLPTCSPGAFYCLQRCVHVVSVCVHVSLCTHTASSLLPVCKGGHACTCKCVCMYVRMHVSVCILLMWSSFVVYGHVCRCIRSVCVCVCVFPSPNGLER